MTTPPEIYSADVTTSASWRSAESRSAPKPTPHPQLERALEELTGKSYRVEIHDELGVVILRHPTEEPVVTAGKIEDKLVAALDLRDVYRED